MSATPLIDRIKEIQLANIVIGSCKGVAVSELQLSALVAEQVALAVAEHKKDAERYRWLRPYGFYLSSDARSKDSLLMDSAADECIDRQIAIDAAIYSTEQTKGA